MDKGYVNLVLHAHLPFVRHPMYERFLEEMWLYEAISESYLPLLRVFNRLRDDGVKFRLTMSFSPTLATMLTDELLQNRYVKHLEMLLELAERELARTENDSQFHPLASMYKDLFTQNMVDFTETYRRNILKGFRALEKEGYLELITTAATNAFLPLYEGFPEAVEAQIHTAVISHGRIFGCDSPGFWLPDGGYYPGLERHLHGNDIHYFYAAAHALLLADQKPRFGVYAPIRCPNGVAVFARDIPSSRACFRQRRATRETSPIAIFIGISASICPRLHRSLCSRGFDTNQYRLQVLRDHRKDRQEEALPATGGAPEGRGAR